MPFSLSEAFTSVVASLTANLGPGILQLLVVLAVLIVGWLVAVLSRAVVRRLTGKLGLNARLEAQGAKVDIESMLATGTYFIILLLTAIAVAGRMNMPQLTAPLAALVTPLLGMVPKVIGAALLAIVAWFLATIVQKLVVTAADATSLDERLSQSAGISPIGQTVSSIAYWGIWLLMLPGILEALGLSSLLVPLQGIVATMMAALPNVVAALLIGGIGWVVAKALRTIVTNLAASTSLDAVGERSGTLGEGTRLSDLIGVIVQILVFVPALTAAVDALGMEALSGPLTGMLDQVTGTVPHLIGAALILGIVHFVAQLVRPMIEGLLAGLGLNDRIPERLGMTERLGEMKPATFVGQLFYFFAMLFAFTEASNRLGFDYVADLSATFIAFGGQVLLGASILLIGFAIAGFVKRSILAAEGDNAEFLATLAHVAILGLVLAMGLGAMGIAPEIVQAATLLTFGAVAVAFALSFGLGGREAAGELAKRWLERFQPRS